MARSTQIRVLALASVAGLACSMSMGQMADTVEKASSRGGKVLVQPGQARQTQREVFLDPIAVRVNGRWVPFTLGPASGDSNTVVYDNVTGTAGNYVVPIPPANTVNPQFALDDAVLGGSPGPRRITGLRPSFATGGVVAAPTAQMGVDITWFQSLVPTNSPVESGGKLDTFVVFAPPAAGWAINTTYSSTQYIFVADGPITTSSGAFEVAMYNAAGTILNPDFTPAYSEKPGGPANGGTSSNTVWIDQNANLDYESTEAVTLPLSANGNPVNIRIAFQTEDVNTSATGSCCLASGACAKLTSAECVSLGGTYGGDNTVCGNCGTVPTLWNNGPLSTGATTWSGLAQPFGGTWSEFPTEAGCTINTFGLSANITGATPFRLADDFSVPEKQLWNVQSLTVYGYVTGGSTVVSPVATIVLRILRDDPVSGATLWGDTTTNVLTNPAVQAVFTNMYRIASTQTNAANGTTTRGVWSFNIPVNGPSGLNLAPGHYYIDYGNNTGFVPMVTLMNVTGVGAANGVRQIEAANGRQFLGAAFNLWTYMGTGGAAALAGTTACIATTSELPFIVGGSKPCYANCDSSAVAPILNANDFQCFLNAFAGNLLAGMPTDYANCDGSTAPPILNANDFQCFLNAFAAGCS